MPLASPPLLRRRLLVLLSFIAFALMSLRLRQPGDSYPDVLHLPALLDIAASCGVAPLPDAAVVSKLLQEAVSSGVMERAPETVLAQSASCACWAPQRRVQVRPV